MGIPASDGQRPQQCPLPYSNSCRTIFLKLGGNDNKANRPLHFTVMGPNFLQKNAKLVSALSM